MRKGREEPFNVVAQGVDSAVRLTQAHLGRVTEPYYHQGVS